MASSYTRKDSPYYWLRLRTPEGRWISRSSGIRVDHKDADRKLSQRLAEENAKEQEQANITDSSIMVRWVPGWIKYSYDNQETVTRYLNAWAHLSLFFNVERVVQPSEVDYILCHKYMKWRTDAELADKQNRRVGAKNTVVTELRVLGAIMHEARARGYISVNPCSDLRIKRDKPKEKVEIQDEEIPLIEQLIARQNKSWMPESWLVLMKTGCRISEVKVPIERVNLKQMEMTLKLKGGAFHTVTIHKDLVSLCEKAVDEGRQFLVEQPDNASDVFWKMFHKNGFDHLSIHCTRVTVITRLYRAGFTAAQVVDYIGHCSEEVNAIYRKLRAKDVAHLGEVL